MSSKTMLNTIVAGITAVGLTMAAAQAMSKPANDMEMEKCFGIAKAGMNDCALGAHACANQSTMAGDPESCLNVPKGTCEKIVNGSVTSSGKGEN